MIDIFAILIGVISTLIIIFFLLRKKPKVTLTKSDSSKDTYYSQNQQNFNKVDQAKDHKEATNKKGIRPEGNQQRDLNREVGGLEESENLAKDTVDPWERRSDEIDREGSIDQLGSAGKKSMIWRNKKQKLDLAEKMENMSAEEITQMNEAQGTGMKFDSGLGNQSGFGQMIKARHDFGGRGGNGGISI